MKSLKNYILNEKNNESEEDIQKFKHNIMFTIWKEPKKKVKWLEDDDYAYQKIEYKFEDKDKHIDIDFLLGYVAEEKTWKLWVGKIGAITYDDDPYCDFKTSKFNEAIMAALDKVKEFVDDVIENPDNWVQFYKTV